MAPKITLTGMSDPLFFSTEVLVDGSPKGWWDSRPQRPGYRWRVHNGQWSDWMSEKTLRRTIRDHYSIAKKEPD